MNTNLKIQKKETSTQFFAVVAALILAAVLASGCSVAPVQGNTINPTTNASASYSNCVNVLTQYGTQTVCNAIGNNTTQSYNTYTYTTVSQDAFAHQDLETAYKSYLSSLDNDTQADLSEQYDALVAQYSK